MNFNTMYYSDYSMICRVFSTISLDTCGIFSRNNYPEKVNNSRPNPGQKADFGRGPGILKMPFPAPGFPAAGIPGRFLYTTCSNELGGGEEVAEKPKSEAGALEKQQG